MRRAEKGDTTPLAPVAVSAVTGEGMDSLLHAIDRAAFSATRVVTFTLAASDGKARAQIAAAGRILEERSDDDGVMFLKAELRVEDAARFAALETPDAITQAAAE